MAMTGMGTQTRAVPSSNSFAWSLTQEAEVASEFRPEDRLCIKPGVAPRGWCGSWRDVSTPPFQVRLGQQHVEASLLHADSNPVTRPHQPERSTDRTLRRYVEDDRTECGTAHACVGDPDHVLDARPAKLGGYRQVSGFGHPGTNRPPVLQHQRIVGMNIKIRIVDASREIVEILEDDRSSDMLEETLIRRCALEDRPVRGHVAEQREQPSTALKRLFHGPDDGTVDKADAMP